MDFTEELKSLGSQLVEMAKNGLDFASQQLPDVARQAMAWWGIQAWYQVVICIILIITPCVFAILLWKHSDDDDREAVAVIVGIIGLLPLLILVFSSIPNLIKFYAAPSIFFLEHVKDLF